MLRAALLLTALSALAACDPDLCGHVQIYGVDMSDPRIEKYREADGAIGLAEYCGSDDGAHMYSRLDLGMTQLFLSPNVPDNDFDGELAVGDSVLANAEIVFWTAHLKKGAVLTVANIAGSGLHKANIGSIYNTYPIRQATITVESGTLKDHAPGSGWSETWKLKWSLDFGAGAEHWEGEDTVTRDEESPIGDLPFSPPDPKPM